MSKNKMSLIDWIKQETATYDTKQFCESHLIPQDISYEIVDFKLFIEARKTILRTKLNIPYSIPQNAKKPVIMRDYWLPVVSTELKRDDAYCAFLHKGDVK